MERVSFVLRIKPKDYKEYVERHRNVYPDLERTFKEVGIVTYSIFYHKGYLFNYMETENYEHTMNALTVYPVYARWQKFMSDMLSKNKDRSVSVMAPEVYHFHS